MSRIGLGRVMQARSRSGATTGGGARPATQPAQTTGVPALRAVRYALAKTVLGVLAQAVLVAALLIAVPAARDAPSPRGLSYAPLGILLGAAESAASIAVCELVMGIAPAWGYATVPLIIPLIVAHACSFLFASRPDY